VQLGDDKILNECGDRDPWPVLAKQIAWGCGSSGTFGLLSRRATNRFHPTGHSDYFDAGFVRDMWRPFLEHGEVMTSDWDTIRYKHPAPWWISALDRFPLRAMMLVMLSVAVFLAFRFDLFSRGTLGPPDYQNGCQSDQNYLDCMFPDPPTRSKK
jgi:hypothetical protein